MTYRLRNIGIAIALALIAVLLVFFYISNYKRTVQQGQDAVSVYVAAKEVPAGTSGADALSQHLLVTKSIERSNLAPGWIGSGEQLKNLSAAEKLYPGDQATTFRFRSESQKGIRAQLTGNLRAFDVPGSRSQLLSGTLKAGDRIDVVGSWNVPEGVTRHFARVILRNLLVLQGATSNSNSKLTNPNEQQSVMLALTDGQAQKLFWMMKNGEWSLQLRPTTDAADSPESAETAETLLRDGLPFNQFAKLAGKGLR